MNSAELLEQFNSHCMAHDSCDHCRYKCGNYSDIMECAAWYGYNKGVGDFAEKLKENINYYDNDVYDSNDIVDITLKEMWLCVENDD